MRPWGGGCAAVACGRGAEAEAPKPRSNTAQPPNPKNNKRKRFLVNKEICFISSPGNGLSCCCCQSEVRSPSPTLPGKWNEAADPNLSPMQAVETESIGNSRAGSTPTCRSAKGVGKEEEEGCCQTTRAYSKHATPCDLP